MKYIIICFASLSSLILLSIGGCKKELDLSPKSENIVPGSQAATDRNEGGVTVIGPKHTLPYKVDIIKQAYNNLYEPDIASLAPNYLYVRFLPQSPPDVKKLLDSGLELWDFPLDNEIITFGERYHDPAVTDSAYTWQYAVVAVGVTLPAVQYEVLEQLALVPEESAIAQEAFLLTGNEYQAPEQFEAAPPIVNGKFAFLIEHENPIDGGNTGGGPEGGSDCNCPIPDHQRKPSGCVQVFDNMLNGWEGVKQVDVITSKSQIFGAIFHHKTETDNNGCWMINHKYHGKIHVWVRWENSTCDIKTMEGNVDLWGYTFSRRAHIGSFWGPNYNNLPIKFNFTNAISTFDFRNWVASTANNAVFEYGGFVASQGIAGGVPGDMQILVTPWGSGGNTGAAPMLDKMGFIQQVILFGSANALLAGVFNVFGITVLVPIASWLEVFAPDISLNVNNPGNVNSDDIREIIYHELSHAMHFNKAGSNYWLNNIAYTVLHLGYGDGTAPGAGRCSVIESWGFQVGMISTHLRYGSSNSNGGNTFTNTWRRILERDFAWTVPASGPAHIPYAWEWDIQDNNLTNPSNEVENSTVTAAGGDRVLGITNAQIFSTMNSSMQSIPQMKTALVPFLPPTVSISTYNTLCGAYGF